MPDTHGVVRAGLSGITRSVVLLTGLAMLAQVGCSQYPRETGYADQCKTQLQFFAPPGAVVSVKGCPPSGDVRRVREPARAVAGGVRGV